LYGFRTLKNSIVDLLGGVATSDNYNYALLECAADESFDKRADPKTISEKKPFTSIC
jgi:hypothetical protein